MSALAILQNEDFEGPGALPAWASEEGFSVRCYQAYEGELPAEGSFTHLAVLGTPHSVHEMGAHPWMQKVASLVAESLAANKGVLGICFGAQLLAQLLGGEVKRGPVAEIGWHPFPGDWPAAYDFLGGGLLFQWHREHFTLPPACQGMGISAAGYLAGFCLGPRVLGLSGHLEITPELVRAYVARSWSDQDHAEELAKGLGSFRQTPAMMNAFASEPGQMVFAEKIFRAWLHA